MLFLLTNCFVGGSLAIAQQPVVIDHEYEYKAAYLYHFAKLCKWPDEMDTIVIGVLGPDPFGRQPVARIERQSQGSIKVEVFTSIDKYTPCQILFVSGGPGAEERLQAALDRTGEQAILIFTEKGNFDPRVAVSFHIPNNRLKLRLNLNVATAAGVEIHARLQNLKSVETGDGDR